MPEFITSKPLISIDKIKESKLSRNELVDQCKVRQEIISQMVGTLYPAVLYDEIVQIQEMLYDKEN